MKLLILAGGSGTRLWPLSREHSPKQVQPVLDGKTLLQHTWVRLRRAFAARDVFVSTTARQRSLVRRQLPALAPANLIVEPVGRNTAPAISLAARILAQRSPREAVAAINSDHYIAQPSRYLAALGQAERVVRALPQGITMIGIRPTYPETGYGYVEVGRPLRQVRGARHVVRFAEKPSPARARRYVASGRYLWNSGLFLFFPTVLLELLQRHAPLLARALDRVPVRRSAAGEWVAGGAFRRLPAVSLDYAVIERTAALAVVPASFGWSDVGSFRAVHDIVATSPQGNAVRGLHLGVGSYGNVVYAPQRKLVVTLGLRDTVIIDTRDALLVCPRSRAQEVRRVVAELRRRPKLKHYL